MKHSCILLKIPFFCAMWVRLIIFLLFISHLYRSLLASQPSKQSMAVRQSKLRERAKTHSPEGPQLDDKMGQNSSQPVKRSPLVLCTKVRASRAMPLLPGTCFSPAVFPSPSPSVLGLVWVFMGCPGERGCCWMNLRLRGNPSSY